MKSIPTHFSYMIHNNFSRTSVPGPKRPSVIGDTFANPWVLVSEDDVFAVVYQSRSCFHPELMAEVATSARGDTVSCRQRHIQWEPLLPGLSHLLICPHAHTSDASETWMCHFCLWIICEKGEPRGWGIPDSSSQSAPHGKIKKGHLICFLTLGRSGAVPEAWVGISAS